MQNMNKTKYNYVRELTLTQTDNEKFRGLE